MNNAKWQKILKGVFFGILLGIIALLMGLILVNILDLKQKFVLGHYYQPRHWLADITLLIGGLLLVTACLRYGLPKIRVIKKYDIKNILFYLAWTLLGMLGGSLSMVMIIDMVMGVIR